MTRHDTLLVIGGGFTIKSKDLGSEVLKKNGLSNVLDKARYITSKSTYLHQHRHV